MREDALQAQVIRLAADRGLLAFHSGDARRDTGPGFPDLVIAGRGGVRFAELKSADGDLSADQRRWKWALIAGGARWVLWRPADLASGAIAEALDQLTGADHDA